MVSNMLKVNSFLLNKTPATLKRDAISDIVSSAFLLNYKTLWKNLMNMSLHNIINLAQTVKNITLKAINLSFA